MASLPVPTSLVLSPSAERLLLQSVIAIAGFVPVGFGLAGAIIGSVLTGGTPGGASDVQLRFLSGLLVGIGLAYWEAIPQIEIRAARIGLLTLIVMLGGLVCLIGVVFVDGITTMTTLCLAMELVVAPLICLWQARVARRFGAAS